MSLQVNDIPVYISMNHTLRHDLSHCSKRGGRDREKPFATLPNLSITTSQSSLLLSYYPIFHTSYSLPQLTLSDASVGGFVYDITGRDQNILESTPACFAVHVNVVTHCFFLSIECCCKVS
jgi:hypothetical protein